MIKIGIIPDVKKYYDNISIVVDVRLIKILKKIFKKSKIHIISENSKLNTDLLVLSGGNTIPNIKKNNENNYRHKLDKKFVKEALKKNIPIVGICHGAQFLAKLFNSKLKINYRHGKLRKHKINLSIKNKKYKTKVNSYHNISIVKLGKNLIPFAITDENFIEGFQHKEKRILGIMWHPEREVSYNWFYKIILKKIIK